MEHSYCEDFHGATDSALPEDWSVTAVGSPVGVVRKLGHAGNQFGSIEMELDSTSPNGSGWYFTTRFAFFSPGDIVSFRWRHDKHATNAYGYGLFANRVAVETAAQYACCYDPGMDRFGVLTTSGANSSMLVFSEVPVDKRNYRCEIEMVNPGSEIRCRLYDGDDLLQTITKTTHLAPASPNVGLYLGARIFKTGNRTSDRATWLDWVKVKKG